MMSDPAASLVLQRQQLLHDRRGRAAALAQDVVDRGAGCSESLPIHLAHELGAVFILRLGKRFMEVITPSWLALLPLIVLFWFPENYDSGSLAGVAITVLVISLLLACYAICPRALSNFFRYLGRNSLAIVVFSPIFTVLTKQLAPWFSFDPTAISFLVVALTIVVGGCLASAWLCDKLLLSRLIFLKRQFYVPLES